VIANKEITPLDNSAVKLTLTVGKDEVQKKYKEVLSDYSKKVQLPGFRRGKVPTTVIEKKFGEGIKGEAAHKLIDEAYQKALEELEKKPLGLAPPVLEDQSIELQIDEDFRFSLVYDTFPEITLGSYKGIEVEVPSITIGKKEITEELEKIQDQNAMILDKNGKSAKGDMLTINTAEVGEDGQIIPGTERQDFVFTLGTGQNLYKLDDELIGFSKEEERILEKAYPEDFESPELAGRKLKIQVKVTAIKEKKLPEINDELAQDVNDAFKTLEDLEKDIKQKLTEQKDQKLKTLKLERILDSIAASSPFQIPQSMINAELEQAWKNFAHQNRMDDGQLLKIFGPEGKKSFLDNWKEGVEKNVRHQLILGKILEAEKIETTEEELEGEILKQAELAQMTADQAKDYFKKNHLMHALEHEVKDRKVVALLLESSKEKKGKKTSYQDLIQGNL